MISYMLQAKNGSYLARAGSGGNDYYLTSLMDKALRDNPKKLNNIRNSIPKNLQIYQPFNIISYNSESNNISKLNTQNINVTNIKESITDLQNDLHIAMLKEADYIEEQKNIDREISDILHYIEFHKFSASEGYKLCKRIQELRDMRRNVKNMINTIHIFKTMDSQKIVNGDILHKLNLVDNKIYSPRILKTLFTNGKKRERDGVVINYCGNPTEKEEDQYEI